MREWTTESDVFHCTPSRCRGRRVAVDIFPGVFLLCLVGFRFFSSSYTSNAHGLLQVRGNLASSTSLLLRRQGRRSEANKVVFGLHAKRPLHTGVRTGWPCLIRMHICLSVCVTFVLFTDCNSCTRPISASPESMAAGHCGLTRGTCFVARRLEVVAVAGRL